MSGSHRTRPPSRYKSPHSEYQTAPAAKPLNRRTPLQPQKLSPLGSAVRDYLRENGSPRATALEPPVPPFQIGRVPHPCVWHSAASFPYQKLSWRALNLAWRDCSRHPEKILQHTAAQPSWKAVHCKIRLERDRPLPELIIPSACTDCNRETGELSQ